jgi:hypothetical protein
VIVLIVAAMAADLLTFALAVPDVGIEYEMNPIMAHGYTEIGLIFVIAVKMAATIALCLLITRVHRRRMKILAFAMAISIPLIGVAGNLTSWWLS